MLLPDPHLLADVAQESELLVGLIAKEGPRTPTLHLTAARQLLLPDVLRRARHLRRRYSNEGALSPSVLTDTFHL